jgi:DNA-binding GntR family transcriptional regulator
MAESARVKMAPIGKRVLSEEVLQALREAIIGGAYRPGERLVEREVAQTLGVSQGPVREAFRKLEVEGLTRTYPHQGTYVVSLDDEDIHEILEVRTALEHLAVKSIIASEHPLNMTHLLNLYQQMLDAAAADDFQAHIETDLTFHRVLCALSGNQRLVDVWELMSGQFRLTLAVQARAMPDSLLQVAESHKALLDAIVQRDMAAANHFFAHNYIVFEPVKAYLRRRKVHSDSDTLARVPA